MQQGQPDDAIPVLQRCVAIDPDYSSCWEGLGQASQSLGRTIEAKGFFNKAIGVGGFNELNAVAIRSAKSSLFMLEHPGGDPMCAPGMPGVPEHLAQCRDYVDSTGKVSDTTAVTHRYGSGFYVSRAGHILTNNQVVAGCKGLTTRGGRFLQIVARDIGTDLALLKGEATPPAFATFRSGPSPKIGDSVIVFGFPLPGILSSDGNVITGVLSATSGLRDDVRFVQLTAPVQPGNSGGPLLDSSGHVIGVVVAKLDVLQAANVTGDVSQNVTFAVHWAEVTAFLDEQAVLYRKAPSQRAIVTRDAAAVASQMSVALDCTQSE